MTGNSGQRLLRYVALVAGGAIVGTSVGALIEQVPTSTIELLLDEADIEEWEAGDRNRMAQALCRDARAAVRVRLAEHVATCPLPLSRADSAWLYRLAMDPNQTVRTTLVSGLAQLLERAVPIERTFLISSWSDSRSPEVRCAMAAALERDIPAVGALSALETLGIDPSPQVRAAAARAAGARRQVAPERLGRLLAKLARDDHADVRRAALTAASGTFA